MLITNLPAITIDQSPGRVAINQRLIALVKESEQIKSKIQEVDALVEAIVELNNSKRLKSSETIGIEQKVPALLRGMDFSQINDLHSSLPAKRSTLVHRKDAVARELDQVVRELFQRAADHLPNMQLLTLNRRKRLNQTDKRLNPSAWEGIPYTPRMQGSFFSPSTPKSDSDDDSQTVPHASLGNR